MPRKILPLRYHFYISGNHHQFHFSYGGWGQTFYLSKILSATANPPLPKISNHKIAIRYFPTVLFHVSLDLPLLRFPSSVHVSATHGWELLSVRSMCPIYAHLLLFTCSLIVSMLATLYCTSLFSEHKLFLFL